jgi:putative two-component system response regulator
MNGILTDSARAGGRAAILIVDDDAVTRGLLTEMLTRSGFEVLAAANGREAIEILGRQNLHLVITDWLMPEVDGPELCRWIRAQSASRYVFILMLTSVDDEDRAVEALTAGADEFIRKPIRGEELQARLRSAQRMLGLVSRDVTIFALAELADSRDPETGNHLDRMRHYARILAEEVMRRGIGGELPSDFAELIYMTAPMHDIGKVGIPDAILLKPGQLNNAEFEIMKTHTTIAANALDHALHEFPNMSYMRTARDIALTHHERFDGTGYPDGLKGEAIPLAGRIVGLCDAYDAITARRVYKSAKPHHVARAVIVRSAGTHFDPRIVEAFLGVEAAFMEISARNDA